MATITAYEHASFTVPDVEAAVTFWRDAMNFRVEPEWLFMDDNYQAQPSSG